MALPFCVGVTGNFSSKRGESPLSLESEPAPRFCLVEVLDKECPTILVTAFKREKTVGEGGMEFMFWGGGDASSVLTITEAIFRLSRTQKTLYWKSALDARS